MEKDTLNKPTSSFLNLGVVSSNNSQKSGNRRAPRAPRFSALLLAGKGFLSNKISAMHEENDEDLDSTVLHTYLQFVPAIAHFHIRKRAREKVAMLAIEEDPEVVDQVHYVHDHWAAALFLDISGFTRLSQSLGAEKTKLHCNKFFSKILEVISTYRGDVVKFMGDAVLAIWPVPLGSTDFYKRSACLVAAECAKSIMSVGSYDAEDEVERAKKSDKVQVKLRLHCGLACGPLHMFCVGRKQRSEILVGGDILPQLAQCEKEAKMGQTIMSESFRTSTPSTRTLIKNPHISTSTGKHLPKRSMVFKETKKTEKGNYLLLWERIVELDGNDDSDESSEEEVLKPSEETKSGGFLNKCLPFLSSSSDSKISPDASFLAVGRRSQISHKSLERTQKYIKFATLLRDEIEIKFRKIPRMTGMRVCHGMDKRRRLRMFRAVQDEFVDQAPIPRDSALIRRYTRSAVHEMARHAVDADMLNVMGDMRWVTTMFVKLDGLIPHLSSGNLDPVQKAFLILLDTISSCGGILRQFVQDDKGCVAIGCLGVSGHSFVDNESRILRCAFTLMDRLRTDLELNDVSVGIAGGNAFVGFVGELGHRCEWAMLGPSVNLAARLMSNAKPGKCLVDQEIFVEARMQSTEFTFTRLDPVDAKGYDKPVQVFEPTWKYGNATLKRSLKSRVDLVLELKLERYDRLKAFEQLVLKIAAVIAFSPIETQSVSSRTSSQSPGEILSGNPKESSLEVRRPRSESVFTLSMLTFVLTAMGHGDDLSQLQHALVELSTHPSLIRPAPETRATKAMREGFGSKLKKKLPKDQSDVIHMPQLVRNAVRRHFLFAHLKDKEFNELESSFRRLKIRVGENVYEQEDEGSRIYIIEEGAVDVYVDECKTETLRRGNNFGSTALLFKRKRLATIRASFQGDNNEDGCVHLWYLESTHFRRHIHTEYMFSHATIRNTVYSHIPTKQAKEVHGIVATFMLRQRYNRRVVLNRFRGAVNKVIGINRIGVKKKKKKKKQLQATISITNAQNERTKMIKALGVESKRHVRFSRQTNTTTVTRSTTSSAKSTNASIRHHKSDTEIYSDIFTTSTNEKEDSKKEDLETAEQKSEGSKEDDPWADLDATLVSDDSFESSDEETDEETLEIELSRNRKRRENDPTSLIKSQVGVNSVVGEEHGGLDGAGGASYTAGGGMQIRMIQHLCFSNCAMELKLSHMEKVANAAFKRRDGKATVKWYMRLLALALDERDVTVNIFCNAKTVRTDRGTKPKLMLQSWRFNTEADLKRSHSSSSTDSQEKRNDERRVGIQFTMMNACSLRTDPTPCDEFYKALVEVRNAEKDQEEEMEKLIRKQILVLDNRGRNGTSDSRKGQPKMMINEIRKRTQDLRQQQAVSSDTIFSSNNNNSKTNSSKTHAPSIYNNQNNMSSSTMSKVKPLSTFQRVSSFLPFRSASSTGSDTLSTGSATQDGISKNERRIAQRKYLEWLICIASGYFLEHYYIISFNLCQICLMYMGLPTLRLDVDVNSDPEVKTKAKDIERRETRGIWNRLTIAMGMWGRGAENMKKFKSSLKKLSDANFVAASKVYVLQQKILTAQIVHARSSGKNMSGGSSEALDRCEKRVEILNLVDLERRSVG